MTFAKFPPRYRSSCGLRQRTHQRDDELQLELQIHVQLFARVLTPTYRFTLYEVELDQIDVLTARVRGQEDELVSLRAELNELKAGTLKPTNNNTINMPRSKPIYFQAETIGNTRSGNLLSWGPTNAASCSQPLERFVRPE